MKNYIILLMLSLAMVSYYGCDETCTEETPAPAAEQTGSDVMESEGDVVEAAEEVLEDLSEDATDPTEADAGESVEEPVEEPVEESSMEGDPTEDPTSHADPVIIWMPRPDFS